jgi:hypothetical protein
MFVNNLLNDTTTWSWSYGSWIYNCMCNQYLSPLKLWVRMQLMAWCTRSLLCNKVCQWFPTVRWFSLDTPVSSTNKTDRHEITEILLNTITLALLYITLSFTSKYVLICDKYKIKMLIITIFTVAAEWGEWINGICSVTCDTGKHNRTRQCGNSAPTASCTGDSWEITTCDPGPCAINGVFLICLLFMEFF